MMFSRVEMSKLEVEVKKTENWSSFRMWEDSEKLDQI